MISFIVFPIPDHISSTEITPSCCLTSRNTVWRAFHLAASIVAWITTLCVLDLFLKQMKK